MSQRHHDWRGRENVETVRIGKDMIMNCDFKIDKQWTVHTQALTMVFNRLTLVWLDIDMNFLSCDKDQVKLNLFM